MDKLSFWSLFLVVVFLPLFFIPFSNIPFETSKGLLLVFGTLFSVVFFIMARFSDGKITIPHSRIIPVGLLFMLALFLSSIYSGAKAESLFGSFFDIGSFSFIATSFLCMLMCAFIIRTPKSAKIILLGFIFSSSLVFLFQVLHIFFPSTITLSMMGGKTDTLLGSWNTLGVFASFFSVLALYIIQFFTIPRGAKQILGILMLPALFLVAAVNFYLAWALLGIFSLLIFIYKISYSFGRDPEVAAKKHFPIAPFILFMVSILFFVSNQLIGGYLSRNLELSNFTVSPTFQSTFTVGKSVVADRSMLGIGPNRFGVAWAKYKPMEINNSQLWNTYFDSGRGIFPTLLATTGMLGIATLILFLLVYVVSGFRTIFRSIREGAHWDTLCFFIASLFLFTSMFFFPARSVVFILAFVFLGIYIGLRSGVEGSSSTLIFSDNPKKSFVFLFILVGIMIFALFGTYKYIERFISVPYFRSAITASESGVDASVANMERALSFYKSDLYYRTSSQILLEKFMAIATKPTEATDVERQILQTTLNDAIAKAMSAIGEDKDNYLNFETLGSVYLTVGRFGVQDSFPKAIEAYREASILNPFNPGLKLALAQAAFLDGTFDSAEEYAREAITLKQDYIDALMLMSQIKLSKRNTGEALTFAETALSLVKNYLVIFPEDPTLIKQNTELTRYIDSLKNPE